MNQTCVKLSNYMDSSRCPSNHFDLPCSGNGDCSNVNTCHCHEGWEGQDCSMKSKNPPTTDKPSSGFSGSGGSGGQSGPPSSGENTPGAANQTAENPPDDTKQKITKKGSTDDGSNTIALVFGMVSVVGGVFILFAMMALCYRRSTVPKFEGATPYPPFDPKGFKLPQPPRPSGTHQQQQQQHQHQPPQSQPINHEEIDNRILSLAQLPTYR